MRARILTVKEGSSERGNEEGQNAPTVLDAKWWRWYEFTVSNTNTCIDLEIDTRGV